MWELKFTALRCEHSVVQEVTAVMTSCPCFWIFVITVNNSLSSPFLDLDLFIFIIYSRNMRSECLILRVYNSELEVHGHLPSVLWCCCLGGRRGIRPVKNWVVRCLRGYLSGARCGLAYAQLMPLPLTVSCFSKIQIGFTFLVLAHYRAVTVDCNVRCHLVIGWDGEFLFDRCVS